MSPRWADNNLTSSYSLANEVTIGNGDYWGFSIYYSIDPYDRYANGILYALYPDGKVKWKYTAGATIIQPILNIGLDSVLYFTSTEGYLHALKITNKLKWKVKAGSGFSQQSAALSPDSKTIYINGTDSNLYAYNQDSTLKWIFRSGRILASPMTDSYGNLYFLTNSRFYSLRADGSVRWFYPSRSVTKSAPCLDRSGNIAYIGKDSLGRTALISLNSEGYLRWIYSIILPGGINDEIWQPLICDASGSIYFGSTAGNYYYAIDSSGSLLWKFNLSYSGEYYQVDNTTSIGSDGTLYIGVHLSSTGKGQKRTLIAFNDDSMTVLRNEIVLRKYTLSQNYPNPFNSTTKIEYEIKNRTTVLVEVFDILGKKISTLIKEEKPPGRHTATFFDMNLPGGVYFYKLTAGGKIQTRKMILLK